MISGHHNADLNKFSVAHNKIKLYIVKSKILLTVNKNDLRFLFYPIVFIY